MTLRSTCVRVGLLILAGVTLCAVPAFAQDTFQALQRPTEEALNPMPLLYAAYAVVWGATIVYVFLLWRRLGKVEQELAEVNAKISAKPRR